MQRKFFPPQLVQVHVSTTWKQILQGYFGLSQNKHHSALYYKAALGQKPPLGAAFGSAQMIMASYMCVYCLMDVVFFSQVGFTSAPGFIKVISFPEFSRMHESHVVSLSSLNRVGILGPLSWNCSFDCLQLVLNRIYRILGYSFVNVFFVCKRIFEYLLCNELLLLITIVSVHVTCARCIAHA